MNHSKGYLGEGIIVAMIDFSDVDFTHPEVLISVDSQYFLMKL
jgi:hypothetical protein